MGTETDNKPDEQHIEPEKPMGWLKRKATKKTIQSIQKKVKKMTEEHKHNVEELIRTIWALTEIIDIYEDDECTKKTTLEDLYKKESHELIKLLEDMLKTAEEAL